MAVDRLLAHPQLTGELVHAHPPGARRKEQPAGRVDDHFGTRLVGNWGNYLGFHSFHSGPLRRRCQCTTSDVWGPHSVDVTSSPWKGRRWERSPPGPARVPIRARQPAVEWWSRRPLAGWR